MNKSIVYGYARVSTTTQKIERQIDNIKREYPGAVVYTDEYTGTKLDRPGFTKLLKTVDDNIKKGNHVTICFDEVSRMSRNAEEGFKLYQELFNKGVELVFLKEQHINTSVYKQALKGNVTMTGQDVDIILKGVNEYLMILAKRQIEIAFIQAQKEVDFLHQRTSEGVRKAIAEGKRVGREKGSIIETSKSKKMKVEIQKYSKDFDGSLSDVDVMKLTGLARNTYYKYKGQIKENRIVSRVV